FNKSERFHQISRFQVWFHVKKARIDNDNSIVAHERTHIAAEITSARSRRPVGACTRCEQACGFSTRPGSDRLRAPSRAAVCQSSVQRTCLLALVHKAKARL